MTALVLAALLATEPGIRFSEWTHYPKAEAAVLRTMRRLPVSPVPVWVEFEEGTACLGSYAAAVPQINLPALQPGLFAREYGRHYWHTGLTDTRRAVWVEYWTSGGWRQMPTWLGRSNPEEGFAEVYTWIYAARSGKSPNAKTRRLLRELVEE